MDHVLGLMVGIGLSAACGFRIFVPLLGMSIAHLSGHLSFSSGFEWIGSWPALIAFATATLLEIIGYFIPWVDNLLDTASTPTAITAATILTASQVGEMSPFLKWSLAAAAGGGVCAVVQTGTVTLRVASTGTTGGFGNFIVAFGELIAACIITVLAIVVPIICFFGILAICGVMIWKITQRFQMKREVIILTHEAEISIKELPSQLGQQRQDRCPDLRRDRRATKIRRSGNSNSQ